MWPRINLLLILFQLRRLYCSDQRCLLDEGGSTETFFVREDSQVGDEVGRLRINGQY